MKLGINEVNQYILYPREVIPLIGYFYVSRRLLTIFSLQVKFDIYSRFIVRIE